VEPRSERFVEDYFTAAERAWVRAASGADRHLLANLVWSAKEAGLKAVRRGLRADTRSVEFESEGIPSGQPGSTGAWRSFAVRFEDGQRLQGCWRFAEGFVWTVVTDAPPSPAGLPGAGDPDPAGGGTPYR
jgi:4'-phosphopantetheinyl transferase EntD